MTENTNFMALLEDLFRQGLSELPVLYNRVNGTYLGYMVYEKGHLAFRDSGLFSWENPDMIDWERNVIGMVCYREMLEWKSLTFYGVHYCRLNEETDPVLRETLGRIKNDYGDHLHDFVGSIYRAYRLLLSNEFLPVVLLQQSLTENNHQGLLIADLRAASLPRELMQQVHDLVLQTLDIRMTIGLDGLAA